MDGDNTAPATSNDGIHCRERVLQVGGQRDRDHSPRVIGQNVTYRARLDRPNPATGNLNATSGSRGPDAAGRCAARRRRQRQRRHDQRRRHNRQPGHCDLDRRHGAADGSAGEAFGKDLVIKYDAARFTSRPSVTVSEQMNVTVLGGTLLRRRPDSQNTTLSNFTADPQWDRHQEPGQMQHVFLGTSRSTTRLDADSTGNVGLDNFTISDSLPQNFALVLDPTADRQQRPGRQFHHREVPPQRRHRATLYTWPGSPFAAAATTSLKSAP